MASQCASVNTEEFIDGTQPVENSCELLNAQLQNLSEALTRRNGVEEITTTMVDEIRSLGKMICNANSAKNHRMLNKQEVNTRINKMAMTVWQTCTQLAADFDEASESLRDIENAARKLEILSTTVLERRPENAFAGTMPSGAFAS